MGAFIQIKLSKKARYCAGGAAAATRPFTEPYLVHHKHAFACGGAVKRAERLDGLIQGVAVRD